MATDYTDFGFDTGELNISCDICDEEEDFECEGFVGGIEQAKEYGWKVFKLAEDNEWHHVCPTCVENGRRL